VLVHRLMALDFVREDAVAAALATPEPEPAATPAPRSGPLTAREREVVLASRTQPTVADIAAVVHLSPGTVRNHLSAAMTKLGAHNRAEALRTAEARGWL
jgi:two-component system response regulator DesR